jgi:ribonuclease BN (tRNA processing enzyme)
MTQPVLTVAGSGDAFGSGGRGCTCFHVSAGAGNFLIDCGAGASAGLKKANINVLDLDAVFISHFHGDHYGGLPFILLEIAIYGQLKPLKVISPPGCQERLKALMQLLYPGTEVWSKLDLEFISYTAQLEIKTGNYRVQAFPVIHTKEALPHALRISIDGKTISYSGDTEWTDVLLEVADEADLFICECNFFDFEVKGHLNYQVLSAKLPLFTSKEILLTHLDTQMLDRLDEVSVKFAYDGLRMPF